jgi:hypothetical protein
VREKYCWLVADKPSEQAAYLLPVRMFFWVLFSAARSSPKDKVWVRRLLSAAVWLVAWGCARLAVADAPAAWGAPDLPPGCARWWSSRSRGGGSWAVRCGSGARPQRATAPPRWVALLRFLKGWRDGGPWVEWNSHADSSAARRCGRGPSAGASLVARRWSGGRRSRGALPAGWCCAPWDIRQDIAASSSSSTASSRRRPRGRGRA